MIEKVNIYIGNINYSYLDRTHKNKKKGMKKMAQKNNEEKMDEMMDNYKNIREALTGLYEIVNINFAERNIYHQVAMDNLKALHENIVEMMKNTNLPREVRMRMREMEFDEMEMEKNFPL